MTTNSSWTRREFVSTTALGVIGLAAACKPRVLSANERLAYVGTYTTDGRSKGIYRLMLDGNTGAMRLDGVAAETASPSYLALHPNGRVLYAVNELSEFEKQETGALSAFAIDANTGNLSPLGQKASAGKAPCYVSVDRDGKFVLVANYVSGTYASFPIQQDGSVGPASAVVRHEGQGVHPKRQTSPHAHCILPDPANRFVLATDLGLDTVSVFRLDAVQGSLTEAIPPVKMKPGAGPRHLTFHPSGRFVYVLNELDSTVGVFAYDADTGRLTESQVTAASPGGKDPENHPADVHVASSGRVLYASNRGDDTIAVFAIDAASGQLTPLQQISTGGKAPRNFALDPSGRFLLAANQRSDSIVSFAVDAESGRLTPTGHQVEVFNPVCIRWGQSKT